MSDADRESLSIMGAVVGGWGALIVLFSVASTLGITVRQRAAEIGLLRTIGGDARGRPGALIRSEALLVTAVAAAAGAVVASVGGRALLAMLRCGGMIARRRVRRRCGLARRRPRPAWC